VVLITGGARRIGLCIALEMARTGWDVAVHHHRSAPDQALAKLRGLGAKAHAFKVDLADETACGRLVPAAVEHFGRLDAVVNNASRFVYDNVDTFSHAQMDAHWRANTAPAIVLSRALHRHLQARDAQGCVINIVDQKLSNPNPDHLSYTLSKAALGYATAALAIALAPRIRVCAVAPGLTLGSEHINEGTLTQLKSDSLLGRGAEPGDIARAVAYLLGASAVTGVTLHVDGGQHLQKNSRDFAFQGGAPPSEAR
jgi:NAD(P)-dependent dehydrogenase (short-subunit alcohol dehydrogenase family)